MCMNEPVPDDADVTEIPVKQENSFGERPDLEPMERLNLPNNITSYVTQIRNQPFDITRKYMLNEVDIFIRNKKFNINTRENFIINKITEDDLFTFA